MSLRGPRWLRLAATCVVLGLVLLLSIDTIREAANRTGTQRERYLAVLGFDCVGGELGDNVLCSGIFHYLASELTQLQRLQPHLWVIPIRDVVERELRAAAEGAHSAAESAEVALLAVLLGIAGT